MADTKEFRTRFNIGAVWTGQKGVQAAQRSLGNLQKTAQRAHTHFRGMASSVFKGMVAYGVASKAVEGLTTVLFKSIAAASEAQEAHDELRTSIERMSTRYKNTMGKSVAETTRIVEESTQALINASEEMEKTGHDAETLQKGWAKLAATGALDPQQILAQRDAFSDVLSYIHGANATAEESANLGELWADAILRGNLALAKQMDLTTGEIELIKNVTKLEKKGSISATEAIKRRQGLMLKFGKKFRDETKRVFETPTGKIQQMWTQVGNVLEEIGKPFIELAPEMAGSFKKIAVEVKPIAEELAKITAENLKDFAKWLDEGGAATIVKNLGDITKGIKGLEDALNAANEAVTFKQSIWQWLQGVGEPAPLAKTPGQPDVIPQGGPGTEGEAARRARQGRANLEKEVKARAEAEKAVGAGWSTEPARILKDFKIGGGTAANRNLGGVLSGKEQAFIEAGEKYGVDPLLLMAIAKAETGHGTSEQAVQKKNVGGIWDSVKKEYKTFATVEESIDAQAKAVAEIQKKVGKNDIAALAKEYAPVNAANDPNRTNAQWPGMVQSIYQGLVKPGGGGGGAGQDKLAGLDPNLVSKLDVLQQQFGKLNVRSGYRSAAKNAAVGGAPKSQHTHGKAVDIDVSHMSQEEQLALINAASAAGIKGIGVYGKTLHFDVGPRRSWGPSHGRESVPGWAEKTIQQHEQKTASLRSQTRGLGGTQQVAGATNINMNAPITVNGVAPGREALMAKKTALALRDPLAEGLRQLRALRAEDHRTNFA